MRIVQRLARALDVPVTELVLAGLLGLGPHRAGDGGGRGAPDCLFDSEGHRLRVDPQTGRADIFDKDSRRTGWGRMDPATGRIELFDSDARRRPLTAPLDPGQKGRR